MTAGLPRGLSWLMLAGFSCLLACGDERPELTPLRGTLLFNERPAAGAELVFHPQFEGPGWRPTATSGGDGSFAAGTMEPGDGAPAGEYKVTVVWHPDAGEDGGDPGPNALPGRYERVETTDLRIQAGPASEGHVTLRIAGPSRGKRR